MKLYLISNCKISFKQQIEINTMAKNYIKRISRVLYSFLLIFSIVVQTTAQDRLITGKVSSSEDNSDVPGASVRVKGGKSGTTTDATGNFKINAPANAILVISSVGYASQEVSVGNRSNVNVMLATDAAALNEVIVVGYGTQKAKNITTSISTVTAKQIESLPIVSVEQALQGRTPGVQVTRTSGAPGSAMNVRVRGVGSAGDSDPVYVVDGVIIGAGDNSYGGKSGLYAINPNDIESMTVLKDASAAAIYGSSAGNGVILITTKRGKTGKPKISFDSYYGVQNVSKKLPMLNARQYAELMQEERLNAGLTLADVPSSVRNLNSLPADVNWQDAIFRTGSIQSYNLSVSGGNENSSFSLSGNMYREEGTQLSTWADRKSLRANSDFKVNKSIRIGESLMFTNAGKRQESAQGGTLALTNVLKMGPTVPIYDDTFIGGFRSPLNATDGQDANNAVAAATLTNNFNYDWRVLGNIFAEVDLFKGLTYKILYGLDFNHSDGENYTAAFQGVDKVFNANQYQLSKGTSTGQQVTHTLTYGTAIGQHNIDVLGGFERRWGKYNGLNAQTGGLPNDVVKSIGAGKGNPGAGSDTQESAIQSYFGRVNYSMANKYFLQASARYDASSKLAKENQGQLFPAVSVGWRISAEDFMKDLTIFSDLKLKAGYGEIGNVNSLGNYPTALTLNQAAFYNFNGGLAQGYTLSNANNPNIRWETAKTTNIGIDAAFLNNRITFTAEYYIKTTDGLQYFNPFNPPSTGLGSAIINLGQVENKGFDFGLGYNKSDGDFKYSINANLSTVNNKLTKLGENLGFFGPGYFLLGGVTRTLVGEPIGSFYGYQVEKIFGSKGEVDAANALGDAKVPYQAVKTSAGDIKYKDNNASGEINADDKVNLGSPIPNFTYGLTGNASYKGLDFTIFLQGVQGNKVLNAVRSWTEGMEAGFNASASVLNRWTPSNTGATIPRAILGDPNDNKRMSDRFIEDGSYMRVKNVTIGYTLPRDLLKTLGNISNVRVYATAQNLLTFTKYTGFDPELGTQQGGNQSTMGIDIGNYPQPKTFIFGVQFGF